MTGPGRPPLLPVLGEQDQVSRLNKFCEEHPGVLIHAGLGYWQAQLPEPTGETIITRYRLEELLDKLDILTGQPDR